MKKSEGLRFFDAMALACTAFVLAGCFESKTVSPPTKEEFYAACVKMLVRSEAGKTIHIRSGQLVSACNCIAEQIQRSKDPDFRVRMQRAVIDADADTKVADANGKALMKSLPEDSTEYLVEKSKINELEQRMKTCDRHLAGHPGNGFTIALE